ncbi:MAG: hypothetical protein H0V27_08685 [Pyrinomonadaceae bacterium]|nr:hypothetical protein [Pyrinomonadaceae bacterium]
MLCVEFNDRLTDYLEGALGAGEARGCAEHILRCPVCHDLLSEVRNTVSQCRIAGEGLDVPQLSSQLEARILERTAPNLGMTCEEFEEHLTDYLDGFLPAHLYHRWERHAAVCSGCTELPGAVVRSIGACYSSLGEPLAVPAGLHAKILQATLGTTRAAELRAPFAARAKARLRGWLDALDFSFAPQFATFATMLLFVALIGTTTISDDGSIGGMYRAGLRLAAQTYARGAGAAVRGGAALPGDLKRVADDWRIFGNDTPPQAGASNDKRDDRNAQPAQPQQQKQDERNANDR